MGVAPKHKKNIGGAEDPFKLVRAPKLPKAPMYVKQFSVPEGLQQAAAEAIVVSGPDQEKPDHGPLALLTQPEWYVYWSLGKLGYREGVQFLTRVNIGFEFGATGLTQLDFLFIDGSRMAFEIQGTRFHFELGTQKIVEDLFRRAQLEAQGWTVIFLDEDRLVADPSGRAAQQLTKDALQGIEHTYYQDNYFIGRTR